MNLTGNATPLSPGAYNTAAALLDCSAAAIQAVAEVETGPLGGFLPDKRPTILFEAHIFGKETAHKWTASHPKISSFQWDRKLYGASGANQYKRLDEAYNLDQEAALDRASWGRFQIMGFNFKLAGFADVRSFVRAMVVGEDQQLMAVVHFIKAVGLADELKNKEWAKFARVYNGAGYATNHYDTKLAAAYLKAGGH